MYLSLYYLSYSLYESYHLFLFIYLYLSIILSICVSLATSLCVFISVFIFHTVYPWVSPYTAHRFPHLDTHTIKFTSDRLCLKLRFQECSIFSRSERPVSGERAIEGHFSRIQDPSSCKYFHFRAGHKSNTCSLTHLSRVRCKFTCDFEHSHLPPLGLWLHRVPLPVLFRCNC